MHPGWIGCLMLADMKHALIEQANQIASDTHRSSGSRWNLLDAGDVAELVWELFSGLIELLFGALG